MLFKTSSKFVPCCLSISSVLFLFSSIFLYSPSFKCNSFNFFLRSSSSLFNSSSFLRCSSSSFSRRSSSSFSFRSLSAASFINFSSNSFSFCFLAFNISSTIASLLALPPLPFFFTTFFIIFFFFFG